MANKLIFSFILVASAALSGCANSNFLSEAQRYVGACRLPNGQVGADPTSLAAKLDRNFALRQGSVMGAAGQKDPDLDRVCASTTLSNCASSTAPALVYCTAPK